jgi:ubiquinol-cytochrome c reductase cytochrome c subunit
VRRLALLAVALVALVALVVLGAGRAGAAPARTSSPPASGLALRGYHLFGRDCLACHNMSSEGTAAPSRTRIGAGPLREQAQQNAVAPSLVGVGALAADFYLRTGYMPLPHLGLQPRRSRVLLGERQIRALVAYVASLGPGPKIPTPHPERGNLSQGLHLFADHCAGCHQIAAEGGYLTGAVAPPLEEATSTQIAEAVRIGPYVMPRFSKRAITDRQLDSIIAYVQYAKHPDDRGGWALGHLGPVPEGLVTWFIAAAVLIATCLAIGKRLKHG